MNANTSKPVKATNPRRKLSPRKITRLLVIIFLVFIFFKILFTCSSRQNFDTSNVKVKTLKTGPYNLIFDDLNDLHLPAAIENGVKHPIANREAAIHALDSLVFIQNNSLYAIDRLTHSIPYLTPASARLLERIGIAFQDSLKRRNIPLRKFVLTSVLRTEHDVQQLQRINRNASANSAHRYGTTVDISTLRFVPIDQSVIPKKETQDAPKYRQILEYVLRDLRHQGYCYVLREYKQHCFHVTSRL